MIKKVLFGDVSTNVSLKIYILEHPSIPFVLQGDLALACTPVLPINCVIALKLL